MPVASFYPLAIQTCTYHAHTLSLPHSFLHNPKPYNLSTQQTPPSFATTKYKILTQPSPSPCSLLAGVVILDYLPIVSDNISIHSLKLAPLTITYIKFFLMQYYMYKVHLFDLHPLTTPSNTNSFNTSFHLYMWPFRISSVQ